MVELEGDELQNFLLSQPPAEEPQELNPSAWATTSRQSWGLEDNYTGIHRVGPQS